jgi:hypothetical protein
MSDFEQGVQIAGTRGMPTPVYQLSSTWLITLLVQVESQSS